jgi:hypothetical protein
LVRSIRRRTIGESGAFVNPAAGGGEGLAEGGGAADPDDPAAPAGGVERSRPQHPRVGAWDQRPPVEALASSAGAPPETRKPPLASGSTTQIELAAAHARRRAFWPRPRGTATEGWRALVERPGGVHQDLPSVRSIYGIAWRPRPIAALTPSLPV